MNLTYVIKYVFLCHHCRLQLIPTYNITNARENLYAIADDVLNNELVTITTKNGNLVVMSEEDWEGVLETLYLMSDPEFDEDVREGLIMSISEREAWN